MIKPVNDKIENGAPVFAFYDIKGKFFDRFFTLKTMGQALRVLEDLANDEKTAIGQHPEDYILYQIGYWNEWSGQLNSIVKVEVGQAIQFKKILNVVQGDKNAISNETRVQSNSGCEDSKVSV